MIIILITCMCSVYAFTGRIADGGRIYCFVVAPMVTVQGQKHVHQSAYPRHSIGEVAEEVL